MRRFLHRSLSCAALLGGLSALMLGGTPAFAGPPDEPRAEPKAQAKVPSQNKDQAEPEIPTIDLLEGLRSRALTVDAEGIGDGRMSLAITNKTRKKLRVVLPPTLVAQGVTGQFGGGGFGGGGEWVAVAWVVRWVAWVVRWVAWVVAWGGWECRVET